MTTNTAPIAPSAPHERNGVSPVTTEYTPFLSCGADGNPVPAREGYTLFGKPRETHQPCAPFGECSRESGNTVTSFGVRTPKGFLLTVWACRFCGAERCR